MKSVARRLRRGLATGLLAGLLAGTAGGCTGPVPRVPPQPGGSPSPAAAAAAHAPDFTLAALDGGTVTLSALRGRWVLVNFWATWCLPCREEMPLLAAAAQEHADTLTVLAVNMREQPEEVAAFLAELGVSLPVLLDPDDATLLAYQVRGLPVSYLVAPDGAIARRILGPVQPGDLEGLAER
jgi:thiol-disulfide isomerase/thioredoxin